MRYIDADKLHEASNAGKDIFVYYYPDYDFGRHPAMKIKVRADEKTASAQIVYYNNLWRITDFGNQAEVNSLPAIPFVCYRENMTYYEALMYIEEVILARRVGSAEWKRPQWRAEYEFREMTPSDRLKEYNFVYKDDSEVTKKDLEAIGRYITPELLREFNCRVLKYYEYCSYSEKHKRDVVHKFTATEDYPIFVFDYGEFKKIYKPHDQEKKNRFLYSGKKPKDYIYGLKQLLDARSEFAGEDDDEEDFAPKDKPTARFKDIFRCSGESDALNLSSLGFHVYWLNSETAELTYDEYKQIDDLCKNHYQIMDLDSTGKQMALKNAVKYIDMFTLELPQWLDAKRDFRGNPCKDLKDFINLIGSNQETTKMQFIYRKAKARKVKFWWRSDKGDYNINMEYFYFFLKANGFYQMEYRHMKNTDYCYVWIKGKVVDLIPPEGIKRIIKRFTKDWIKSKNLTDEIAILNKLNTSNQISETNIDTMDSVEINFKNVSKDYEYLHFKNGSLRISQDKIERIKHEDIPNYILGSITVKNDIISHVIPHNISLINESPIEINPAIKYQELLNKLSTATSIELREQITAEIALYPDVEKYDVKINEHGFIFTDFLRDITRIHWRKELEKNEELTADERKDEMLSLANVMFCIGYLCAQYKNQGKPWIVFLQDTKISEIGKSSGRSGKSLVSKALKFVRPDFYIEGRKMDDKNMFQFIYDGLTEFHDIIEVDDLAEFGDFTFFYTQTTGNRTVNSKHTSPFVLEYEDSGKMVISSNFELPNTDSSTMARLLNCGVSDYYHEQTKFNDYKESRSPLSKFGRQLYADFTADEWIQFYNFIAYCIQLQQRFDKIQPPMDNLERRQLRREMSEGLGREENFLKWAGDYFCVWDVADGVRPVKSAIDADCAYLDTLFVRNVAFSHFMENAGISDNKKKAYNAQRFKTHVIAWAKYNGFTFNPPHLCNTKDGRIMSKLEGKSVELFYISSRCEDANITENELTNIAAKIDENQSSIPF